MYSKWNHVLRCVCALYDGRLCCSFAVWTVRQKKRFHFRQTCLAAGFGRNFRRACVCKITVISSNMSHIVLHQKYSSTSFWSRGRRESKYRGSRPRKTAVILSDRYSSLRHLPHNSTNVASVPQTAQAVSCLRGGKRPVCDLSCWETERRQHTNSFLLLSTNEGSNLLCFYPHFFTEQEEGPSRI
jgi:hypothetical protein